VGEREMGHEDVIETILGAGAHYFLGVGEGDHVFGFGFC